MDNKCKIFKNITFPNMWLIKTRMRDYDVPIVFDLDLESIVYEIIDDESSLIDKSKLLFYYTAISYVVRGWIDEEYISMSYATSVFLSEVNDMLKIAGLKELPEDFDVDITDLYIKIFNKLNVLINGYLRDKNYVYITTSEMLYYVYKDGYNLVTNINISFNYVLSVPNIKGMFCLLENRKEYNG